jgi:hypothetical protein
MDRFQLALRSLTRVMRRLDSREPVSRGSLHEDLRITRYWLLTGLSEQLRQDLQTTYGSLILDLPPLGGCPSCGATPDSLTPTPDSSTLPTPEQLWANLQQSEQPKAKP